MTEPKTEKIKIANLHLDLNNFRYEQQGSQKEAIETMIAEQKDKLVALAKDIFENGLNPSDLIMVVKMEEGNNQYKVMEGNRRVTCLKLIANPNLVPEEQTAIRRQFQKLHNNKERAMQLRRPLCSIFDNEEDADIWIERKHCGAQDGKGTIEWNSIQKNRYNAKHGGKKSLVLQVMNFLNTMSEKDDSLKDVVKNIINTTNIERLLSDPYVKEKLKLKVHDGTLMSFDTIEYTQKKLVKLIEVLLHPNFTVNKIKNKTDRKAFIDDFYDHLDDKVSVALSNGWNLSDPASNQTTVRQPLVENNAKEQIPAHPTKPRAKLIPENVVFMIDEQRIEKVFKELNGMLLNIYPNAVSVLLRVFVELSVDCFIERSGLLPDGNLTSSSSYEPFEKKIAKCIHKLKKLGKINDDLAKGILYELRDKNSSLSIDTMHSFVHNYHFSPKAESLRTGWDNIERFMTILWHNMPPKNELP